MQLWITNLVYNQLTDEDRWEKASTLPSIMQTGARPTDYDLTDGKSSITKHNWLPTKVN